MSKKELIDAKKLHVVVMDTLELTVTSYVIEKEEFEEIAKDIDSDDNDDVVAEFIEGCGHSHGIEYIFSEDEIEFRV